VVLLIMAITVALLMPRLGDPARRELGRQGRMLAAALELIAEEAALTQQTLRLTIDLDAQALRVEAQDPAGRYVSYRDSLVTALRIEPPIRLESVHIGPGDTVAAGTVALHFPPAGPSAGFSLWLSTQDGGECRIRFHPATERAAVEAGCG
jgi:type II secretory pathway pseudopilin PulG